MSQIISIKSWARQRLFSICLWLDMVVFRRSLSLLRQGLTLLDAEIRYLDTSLLQYGENDEQDNVVEYVSRSLTGRMQSETSLSAAATRSEFLVALHDKAKADAKIRAVVATYFRCQAYVYAETNKPEEAKAALLAASDFIPNATPLSVKDILEISGSQRKRYKELRAVLAERSAIKYEIKLANVIAVLTIIPPVMFVAGLVYVNGLLNEFGLKAPLYYTVGDYVASSLNQLSSAAGSVAWALLTIVVGMRHGSLRPRIAAEAIKKKDKMPMLLLLFTTVLAITAIVSSLNGEFDHRSMTLLGILVSYPLAEKFAGAFSKNVEPVQMATIGLLVFATLTYSALLQEINEIRHDRWGARANTVLKLKEGAMISADNLVVIVANSNYVFALDKTTKAAYAISRDQISAMAVVIR